jgi:uncharacterized damage-inducible protein DinB
MNSALVDILRYNRWANLRLVEACRALSDEQLDARPAGVSGPIRVLLMHVVGGQQTFVMRTKGRQHEGELTGAGPWPGFGALIEIATTTSDELIAIGQRLEEAKEVALGYMGKRYRYPASFFLLHAIEHSMEHRTEIKVGLNQLAFETPDLDGWAYAEAMGWGEEETG